jgi:hypothetical protein
MEFTNRATKTYYNNFIKAIEKIKTINMLEKSAAYKSQLGQLEINLKNIKKFEPGLDVSELENQYNSYKNAIEGNDNQKSLDKDLLSINNNFEILFKKLNETKLNFDSIDLQVKNATEPLERDVKIFENKYPNYDSSSFNQKIIDFQTKFRVLLEGSNSKNQETLDFKNEYFKTTKKPHFSIWTLYPEYQKPDNLYAPLYQYTPEDIFAFQNILNNYITGFDSFMNENDMNSINSLFISNDNSDERNTDRSNYEAISISTIIKDHLHAIDKKRVNDLQKDINETLTRYEVDKYFNELTEAYYWIGLAKLHPKQTEIVSIANEYQTLCNLYGSIDDYQAKIRANGKVLAKKVYLPKAVNQDSDLENLIKTAFEHKGWNEEVVKVILLSHDWDLERKDLVLGRVIHAAIASKKEDGDCLLYNATIRQEFAGDNNYSAAYLYSYTSKYIAEENIN